MAGAPFLGQAPGLTMRRIANALALSLLVLAGLATGAMADRQDEIIAQLRAQGYSQIVVEKTWLRRLRIRAEGPAGLREIIIDPRNGEILRDLEVPFDKAPPAAGGGAVGGWGVGTGERPGLGGAIPGRPGPGRPGPDGPRPGGPSPSRPSDALASKAAVR